MLCFKGRILLTTMLTAPAVVWAGSAQAQTIINAGQTLVVNEGDTEAAGVAANTNSVLLNNSGTITGAATAVLVNANQATSFTTGIINNDTGLISGTTNGIATSAYGSITGNIDNSGTITGGSSGINVPTFSGIVGITNNAGGVISGGVNGITTTSGGISGVLLNNAGATITGGTNGIGIVSSVTGSINNAGGTIRGGTYGIAISNGRVDGGITNSGTIDGGIDFNNLTGNTALTLNGGRIIGDVFDNNLINTRSPVTIAGDFTTEGNFEVSTLGVNAGQTFTVSANNTVTLQNMIIPSAGTWSFDLDGGNTATRLTVNGGGVNLTGTTLAAGALSGDITDGLIFQLADGAGAAVGGPGATPTNIVDNSALWDFQLVDGTFGTIGGDNTELYLIASYGANGTLATNADSANSANVGTILEELRSNASDPTLSTIIANLNNASTQEGIDETLDSLSSSPDRAPVMTSQMVAIQSHAIAGGRLEAKRIAVPSGPTGLSAGDEDTEDYTIEGLEGLKIWGQAFNTDVKQGWRDNIAGYDSETTGIMVGADTEELHSDAVVGVSIGYAKTSVEGDDANNASTDIDSYQVAVYGDYDLDDNLFVSGSVGYVKSKNETKRYNVGGIAGLTAQGEYDSDYYYASAEVGRDYFYNETNITPSVTAFYGHYESDGYTETGAEGASLNVGGTEVDVLKLGAKLGLSRSYEFEDGSVIEPKFNIGYSYDILGEKTSTTSQFVGGGSSFRSEGFSPARHTFDLGAGLKLHKNEAWEVELRYDLQYEEDYLSHTTSLRAQYKF